MEFTDLQVGVDGGDLESFADLFALSESSVEQATYVSMIKADVWILPFLNVMGIYGSGENTVNGELIVNQELKDLLILLGAQEQFIPDALGINTKVNSVI